MTGFFYLPGYLCYLLAALVLADSIAGYDYDTQELARSRRQPSSCADTYTPTTFTVRGVAYVKSLTWHFTTTPNSTQLAFEVVNAANGISTGCSLQNVEINGQWGDDTKYWYSCADRSLAIDENEYPVRTSAHIIWDDWKLTVNQTWDCGGGNAVTQISSVTLAPTCQEYQGDFQYVNDCTAPDLEAAATTQELDTTY
ncbi:hypothetical protein Hte_002531 [Hypoxylon texense]